MKTKRLLTINTLSEAHIIQGRLDVEGVESFLSNENFTSLIPMSKSLLGSGIQVFVKDTDYKKACEIVKDKICPSDEMFACPYCGSPDIRIGLVKDKFPKLNAILMSIKTIIPFGNSKQKFYCNNCKKEIE